MTELSVALARAAGVARGGTPVIVRPRPGMPIDRVSLYIARGEQPPGTIVRVLHNLEPSTVANMQRQFDHHARRRAAGAADVPNIVIVTHAPADALERALGRPVQIVETTSAVVGTVMRDEPVRGRLMGPADPLDAQVEAALRAVRGEPGSGPLTVSADDLDAQVDTALRAVRGEGSVERRERPEEADAPAELSLGVVDWQRRPRELDEGMAMGGP